MATTPSTSIARRARTRAEADFATWLMMAKLGSFDDLPADAQRMLTGYRDRLDKMSEIESKAIAVRETYQAYYSEMGGTGAAPEPEARKPASQDNVVRFQKPPKPQPAGASGRSGAPGKRPLPALLIFAAMVALIALYRYLTR